MYYALSRCVIQSDWEGWSLNSQKKNRLLPLPCSACQRIDRNLAPTFGQFLRQGRPPFLTYIGSQGLPKGRSLLTGFGGSLPSGRNAHHGLPHGQPVEDLTAIVKVVNSPRNEGNVVVPTGFEPVF